jgi:oligopeptide/dipeptide ABC transporter ATP-binding protein
VKTVTKSADATTSIKPDAPLLAIEGLCVKATTPNGTIELVNDVGLAVRSGQTVGLVGESGSGKTVTSLAIMGLLPRNVSVTSGSIQLNGRELLGLGEKQLNAIRGSEVAMIFQDAMRSLDPAFTVGDQIAEVARRHRGLNGKESRELAVDVMQRVGIRDAAKRAREYPHMFSGGMCQRIMLATALISRPKLLIADEPTTALDVTVQARVLRLIRELQDEIDIGVLFITHDMGVVAEMCDDVVVMYAGQVVESAPASGLFERPRHPYAEGLLAAIPRALAEGEPFGHVRGTVPPPSAWPAGCRFHPRCDYCVESICTLPPPFERTGPASGNRCARSSELQLQGVSDATSS